MEEKVMSFGPSPWMKKARVFGYARISTAKQTSDDKRVKDVKKKATIKRQIAEVNSALKAQGLPTVKPKDWYAEIASGTDGKRAEWNKMQQDAMMHQGPLFIAVKDESRWGRNIDDAVLAWAPLKKRGIPIYAVTTGIQTGTSADIRPSENFIFILNSGFAQQVSDIQKKKALESAERQKKEGVIAGKGQSLFPFARNDPLDALIDNYSLLGMKPKDGGGKTRLKELVVSVSNPNGATSVEQVNRELTREEERRDKLTPAEYKEWYDYRKMIRNILIENESDPWAVKGNKEGKESYPMKALMRMTGAYLKTPSEFEQRTTEEIQNIQDNFFDFLSDKDRNRYRKK